MKSQSTLGEKIKYFRERAHYSQLALEIETGLAEGSVSRIENGKINPTKETLYRLVEALKLNLSESRFLFDLHINNPTKYEVDEAIKEVAEFFSGENVLAYLVDDNFTMHYPSMGFAKMLGVSESDAKRAVGKNIMVIMFDPSLPIRNMIDSDLFEDIALRQLARFKFEKQIFSNTIWWKELIKELNRYPNFKELWARVPDDPAFVFASEARRVVFNVNGRKLVFSYDRERLKCNQRFEVINYIRSV